MQKIVSGVLKSLGRETKTVNTLNSISQSKKNRHIVLGVAFDWSYRKGLDVFEQLARNLDKEKYQIVLVGTNDAVDKGIPDNIISIHRTQNQKELAEYYSCADVFVMPTREENFPTVNIEALACGTPVITFDTGGSPEILNDKSGVVVPCDDIETLRREIILVCENHSFRKEDCIERARIYDQRARFLDYVKLYEQIVGGERA